MGAPDSRNWNGLELRSNLHCLRSNSFSPQERGMVGRIFTPCPNKKLTSWWFLKQFQPTRKILVKLDQIGSFPQVGPWNLEKNKEKLAIILYYPLFHKEVAENFFTKESLRRNVCSSSILQLPLPAFGAFGGGGGAEGVPGAIPVLLTTEMHQLLFVRGPLSQNLTILLRPYVLCPLPSTGYHFALHQPKIYTISPL